MSRLHLPAIAVLCFLLVNLLPTVYADNNLLKTIEEAEQQLGARVGVAVYDVEADELSSYNGDRRFPLMSTFKTFACAKLLADVDAGRQSLDASVVIKQGSLINWSPISEKHVGQDFSLRQACEAAMLMSDNTAANIVLDGINGPSALTQFMRTIGDDVTRLDRFEPQLNEARDNDDRDTSTPDAIVKSLHVLLYGDVLTVSSKKQLKTWMMENRVAGSLLRSILPEGWSIADRSGAGGYGSRGITAVVWSEKRSPLIIGIYLTQTTASLSDRDKAIAQIGRQLFTLYNGD